MNYRENIVNAWGNTSNLCIYYHNTWRQFCDDLISKECWDNFTMKCLENLMEKNKDVLDRLKNVQYNITIKRKRG